VSRTQRSHLTALAAYVALALAAAVIAVSGLTAGADSVEDVAGPSQVQQGHS
jgi:hypothetical protein